MQLVCNIMRGNNIESQHIVYAVVINEKEEILFSSGDSDYITCIRSSLKPFQASTLIKYNGHKKFNLTEKELSLLCASHSAEKIHTETASNILNKINCLDNDLECGAHPAHHLATRHTMLKKNIPFSSLNNNCSGKHIGMLALAKTLNIDHKNYINKNHIVQQKIFDNVLQYSEIEPTNLAIDGCSVPTPFYSLHTIAKIYMKLINKKFHDLDILYQAMTKYPYMVAGENRFDTDFMLAMDTKGVSKGGGEAIQGLALKTQKYGNIAIALKVLSGSHLVRDVAIMKVLNHMKLLSSQQNKRLNQYVQKPIFNHNKIQTGCVEAELVS